MKKVDLKAMGKCKEIENGPGRAFHCGNHENESKKTRLDPGEWALNIYIREELEEKCG